MSQGSSQVGCMSKYKICICQDLMIDKLWLRYGESKHYQNENWNPQGSDTDALSNYCSY